MKTSTTPRIRVGIMTNPRITFRLHGLFRLAENNELYSGEHELTLADEQMLFLNEPFESLTFIPENTACVFDLEEVTIGVDFHWQRNERQTFKGSVHFIPRREGILAINDIDVETYLISVISSEMSAKASKSLLKAHAVISRSWLLAQIEKREGLVKAAQSQESCHRTSEELICWYDREDHEGYDVCADDHCQRYQGISRSASAPLVEEVIQETRGEILSSGQAICDARFSKCCGGVTELFENCWEPVPHAYLVALRDNDTGNLPDLRLASEAEQWIRTRPEAFCNTTDKAILEQVLNQYDQETSHFYRWEVTYTQSELRQLIQRKSGIDFGDILDLIPLSRGTSGRIYRLQIVGSKRSLIIGKELEIRRTLSESHLYSSAFVVDKGEVKEAIPQQFRLTGEIGRAHV